MYKKGTYKNITVMYYDNPLMDEATKFAVEAIVDALRRILDTVRDIYKAKRSFGYNVVIFTYNTQPNSKNPESHLAFGLTPGEEPFLLVVFHPPLIEMLETGMCRAIFDLIHREIHPYIKSAIPADIHRTEIPMTCDLI